MHCVIKSCFFFPVTVFDALVTYYKTKSWEEALKAAVSPGKGYVLRDTLNAVTKWICTHLWETLGCCSRTSFSNQAITDWSFLFVILPWNQQPLVLPGSVIFLTFFITPLTEIWWNTFPVPIIYFFPLCKQRLCFVSFSFFKTKVKSKRYIYEKDELVSNIG